MTMIQKSLWILALSSALFLSACSSEGKQDFGDSYIQGQSLPPLKMPPGTTQSDIDPYYSVPPTDMQSNGQMSILPPGSLAAKLAAEKGTQQAPATPAPKS